MMMVLTSVLFGVVGPALVAAFVLFASHLISRRGETPPAYDWGLPPAVGLGYLAGHFAIAWPSSDVTDRIPWLVAGAIVLGIFEAARPTPRWVRGENGLIFTLAVLLVMLGPAIQETWGTREANLWLAALGAIVLVAWINLEALAARLKGSALMVPLLAWVGGAGAVLLLSGSMVLGRLGGALASALLGAWLVSRRNSPINVARGTIPVIAVTIASLLLEGHVYAQAAQAGVALVAIAPLLLWITRIGPIRNGRPWVAALIGTVLVLIPIGVALGMAIAADMGDASEY
ncbi:hypothetical protein [Singulisphaera sp. PoT]|uniref:hypothetical protein n=1 Tax=Singulisphaera sp. PoT TaxID=3411797 RepID=UPI003BF53345